MATKQISQLCVVHTRSVHPTVDPCPLVVVQAWPQAKVGRQQLHDSLVRTAVTRRSERRLAAAPRLSLVWTAVRKACAWDVDTTCSERLQHQQAATAVHFKNKILFKKLLVSWWCYWRLKEVREQWRQGLRFFQHVTRWRFPDNFRNKEPNTDKNNKENILQPWC